MISVQHHRDGSTPVLDAILAVAPGPRTATQALWPEEIDHRLQAWEQDPDQLQDEGVEAPSREIVRLARRCARHLCERGAPAPSRVVPDGDGGIIFEWLQRPTVESIEIADDEMIEYLRFVESCLVHRQALALDPQLALR